MTRDDIIHMAREADIDWHKHWDDEENRLERFAALVAAAEREEMGMKEPYGYTAEGECWVCKFTSYASAEVHLNSLRIPPEKWRYLYARARGEK